MTDTNQKSDSLFTEKLPDSLRNKILATAEFELKQISKRKLMNRLFYAFASLSVASVAGIVFHKNLKQLVEPISEKNLEIALFDLSDGLFDQNELTEEDLNVIADLELIENLADEEFEFILEDDV